MTLALWFYFVAKIGQNSGYCFYGFQHKIWILKIQCRTLNKKSLDLMNLIISEFCPIIATTVTSRTTSDLTSRNDDEVPPTWIENRQTSSDFQMLCVRSRNPLDRSCMLIGHAHKTILHYMRREREFSSPSLLFDWLGSPSFLAARKGKSTWT